MHTTAIDLIRGELERLFSLDELVELSESMLGLRAEDVGDRSAKASFARALAERCAKGEQLEALVDVMRVYKREVDPRVFDVHLWGSPEVPVGGHFGPYLIERKLGESHTSIVYAAIKDTRKVALKLLKRDAARDRASVQRFFTANRLVASYVANNVPPQTGVPTNVETGEHEGVFFISYDFVAGVNLAERLTRSGALRFADARDTLIKILRVLAQVHDRGLCHGDLKLENVLVSDDGTVTLIDFGADRLRQRAVSANGHTGLLAVYGSPRNIAPELVRGRAADTQSDVYAFGAVMYELLSGKPVFAAPTATDAAFMHLMNTAEPLSARAPSGWVTKDVDAFVAELLSKEATDRPRDASELLERISVLGRASQLAKAVTGLVSPEKLEALTSDLFANPADHEKQLALETASEEGADAATVAKVFEEAEGKLGEDASIDDRKGLLYRAARVFEQTAHDHAAAERIYVRILEVDETDDVAGIALEEVRRAQGKFEEIVETLLARSESATPGDERAVVLSQIGELYAKELDDAEQALVAYSQALSEDPQNDTYAHAIENLCGTRAERWSEVLETLSGVVRSGELGGAARAAMLVRVGRWFQTKQSRSDLAVHAFREVLSQEPSHEAASAALCQIYEKAEQWPELVLLLTKRSETLVGSPRARDLAAEAAHVYEAKLGDMDAAKRLVEAVLVEDPSHARACEVLVSIAEKEGDAKLLVRALDARASFVRESDRVALLVRIADTYETELGQLDEAVRRLESALAIDDAHVPALKALDRIFSRTNRYSELLSVLERQVEHSATPRQKIALLERIASIYDEEFLNHEKAAEALAQILAVDPKHDASLTAVVRHYRALNHWDAVQATLERHAKATTDDARRVELMLSEARVLAEHIGSPERAMRVYDAVLKSSPNNPTALEALAVLRESSGDAHAALSAIEALAAKADTKEAKAEQWMRAGKLLESRGDKDGAIERYRLAIEVQPDNAFAAGALRRSFTERGEFGNVVALLEQELARTEGDLAKARVLSELALVSHRQTHDSGKAEAAAKRAIALDSSSIGAQIVLGEIAFDAGRLLEASRYYEALANRATALDVEERPRILARFVEILGRTLRASSQPAPSSVALPSTFDLNGPQSATMQAAPASMPMTVNPKVLAAVQAVREHAAGDLAALKTAALVMFEAGDVVLAQEMHEELLSRHGNALTGTDRASVLFRLGESARRAGSFDKARAALQESCDLDPSEAASFASLFRLFEDVGEIDNAIQARTKRLLVSDEVERFDLLLQIGEIEFQKRGNREAAARAYARALEIRPDDRKLLAKLMQFYSEGQDWEKVVDVVLRLADFVEEPKQKAKYLHTAATITARHLKRVEDATSYYERALALDPSLTKAESELMEIYRGRGNYAEIKRLLGHQLEQAKRTEDRDRIVKILDQMADLYEKFLVEPDLAVESLEAAQAFDPQNRDRAERLGELYLAEPNKYFEKAADIQTEILRQNPYKIDAYKTLRKLYTDAKLADPAWCLCQALTVLNLGEPEEERFYTKYRTETAAAAKAVMAPSQWDALAHEDMDPLLTSLFALIEPTISRTRAEPLEALGYDTRYAIDTQLHPYPMSQTLYYARGVFGMKQPLVFQNPQDEAVLGFVHASTPAIVLGKGAFDTNVAPQMLAFLAGRHLAYYRSGFYVRHLVPTGTGLKAWLFAAVKIAVPQFPVSADSTGQVEEAVKALSEDFKGPNKDKLVSIVSKLMQSGSALDLKRWVYGVDATVDRAGLLLAHDLETAVEAVRADQNAEHGEGASSSLATKERLKELVLFATSREYFEIRKKLGIAIDP